MTLSSIKWPRIVCGAVFYLATAAGAGAAADGPSAQEEKAALDKYLADVTDAVLGGVVPMGLLVPDQTDPSARQVAAFGYSAAAHPRFKTVIFLYTLPAVEGETLVLPAAHDYLTAFGLLNIDVILRDRILQKSPQYKTSDEAHLFSKTVKPNLNFLHHVANKHKFQVLPIGVAVLNWETAKDMALHIVKSVGECGYNRSDAFFLIAADLGYGATRAQAPAWDSPILTALESMSGNDVMAVMEAGQQEKPRPLLYADGGPLLVGLFALNQLFCSRGDVLMYANTGQFLTAKKQDQESSRSYAAAAFSFGDKRPVSLQEDRTVKKKQTLTRPLLKSLLVQARRAIYNAIDPSSPPPSALPGKTAQQPHPVFISVFNKEGVLLGQSGSLVAQGPLEEAVRYHAIRAALRNSVRSKMTLDDLEKTVISLSAPTPLKTVRPAQVVPNQDGIFLEIHKRKKFFLPDAWKLYPHRVVFLSELCAQTGVDPWLWGLTDAKLFQFQSITVTENDKDVIAPGSDGMSSGDSTPSSESFDFLK